MNNSCTFSPCRRYRYLLTHEWESLLQPAQTVLWIGLNPSTADESSLDPTLRRVRSFTEAMGGNAFVMANIFAFRATDPAEMMTVEEPVGRENDFLLLQAAVKADRIVACWGTHGGHLGRERAVRELLGHLDVWCMGVNGDGSPKHPLYLAGATQPQMWQAQRHRYETNIKAS